MKDFNFNYSVFSSSGFGKTYHDADWLTVCAGEVWVNNQVLWLWKAIFLCYKGGAHSVTIWERIKLSLWVLSLIMMIVTFFFSNWNSFIFTRVYFKSLI